MAEDSVMDRMEKQAGKALIKNAVFRLESALMIGGTILATVFLPELITWIPAFVWPILGAMGEAAVIFSTLTDKAEQQKAIESMFREKYSTAGIRDRNLRDKLNEAEQYRQRIQAVVDQQRSGVLRDRLKATTTQVYDWIANMVTLARRIDAYRMDPIIRRDITNVPRDIEVLKRRLSLERDAGVRDQMTSTLESSQRQQEALQELKGRMERADLQLDHSLAALGTVYSQFLLIGSKDVDSDRTERLRDDIRDQVLALQDIVDSLNEVYSSGGVDDVETIAAAKTRREQAAGEIVSMKRTSYFLLVIFTVMVLVLSGCGSSTAPTKGEVTVYVAGPLSGFQANTGQTVAGGVRLMAEQLNRSGGLLGYKVKVIALDDEADSDVAVSVADQIKAAVERGDKVIGVIGHPNSGQTEAAMQVYKDLALVVITPTASEVGLTQKGYRNFFRVNAANDLQAQTGAQYLVSTLGAKKVAVLYNDDTYGIDLGKRVAAELKKLGAEVPLTRQVKVEQNRFPDEVSQIKNAGVDAVYYAGYEVECPYLRADLRDAGLDKLTFMASDGCFLAATIDNSDGAAEGMYVTGFAPSPRTAVDQAWVQAYQAVEYRNPDTYSVNGYSAMQVLADGIKKAGTLNASTVADAIRKLDVKTPLGDVQYQDNGDLRAAQIYIFQVKDSQFVQVAP